ncbi:predicted protein, partial [Micromonas commoda]
AHLDVKPDNILVKNGVYKLGDWGRAAPVDGVGYQSFGSNGESRGRSASVLPGDFVGLDRADIFSLGATAFELARGAPLPSHGDEYQALRQGKVPALNGFSVSFQQMIAGMM